MKQIIFILPVFLTARINWLKSIRYTVQSELLAGPGSFNQILDRHEKQYDCTHLMPWDNTLADKFYKNANRAVK
jgi:hypothetical protein